MSLGDDSTKRVALLCTLLCGAMTFFDLFFSIPALLYIVRDNSNYFMSTAANKILFPQIIIIFWSSLLVWSVVNWNNFILKLKDHDKRKKYGFLNPFQNLEFDEIYIFQVIKITFCGSVLLLLGLSCVVIYTYYYFNNLARISPS